MVGLLTGLEEPTSGCSFIVGRSLHDERASARQHIGYCPQANVLFSSLTVYEHLLFFAAVKCLSGKQASAAAEEMLQALDLAVKKDAPVNALSGGMKRRLQVRSGCRATGHFHVPAPLCCGLHAVHENNKSSCRSQLPF